MQIRCNEFKAKQIKWLEVENEEHISNLFVEISDLEDELPEQSAVRFVGSTCATAHGARTS